VVRIGIDFDNTLAGYDAVFLGTARRAGLVHPQFTGGKQAVRDTLRQLPDGELAWQKLQGQVYGAQMPFAVMLDGAGEFLRRCRAAGHDVYVVSHKSEYGHFDPARINLRQAALKWMAEQGFFREDGFGLAPERIFFEGTRGEKIRRIAALECVYFIDDLEEVLTDPAFPAGVRRILLADEITDTWSGRDGVARRENFEGSAGAATLGIHCRTWREVAGVVFGERG
jgi:hypothetical protein